MSTADRRPPTTDRRPPTTNRRRHAFGLPRSFLLQPGLTRNASRFTLHIAFALAISVGLGIASLLLLSPTPAQAVSRELQVTTTPTTFVSVLPATFSGTINFFGRNATPWQVSAWITDVRVAGPVAATLNGQTATYEITIPPDNPNTTFREGGQPGDIVRFKVEGYSANELAIWTSGASTTVNLTVLQTEVCVTTYFDANANGNRDAGEGPAVGGSITLQAVQGGELIANYTITDQTQPHCIPDIPLVVTYRLTFIPPSGQALANPLEGEVIFLGAPPPFTGGTGPLLYTFRSVPSTTTVTPGTASPTPTRTQTVTPTLTATTTNTHTATPTHTASATATLPPNTSTVTPTDLPTLTGTPPVTATASTPASPSQTATSTATATPTFTPSPTVVTVTPTLTATPSPSPTVDPTGLCVFMFRDQNGNNLWDAGEPALPDGTFVILSTTNQVLSPVFVFSGNETSPQCFRPLGIANGTFRIVTSPPPGDGWDSVYSVPAGPMEIRSPNVYQLEVGMAKTVFFSYSDGTAPTVEPTGTATTQPSATVSVTPTPSRTRTPTRTATVTRTPTATRTASATLRPPATNTLPPYPTATLETPAPGTGTPNPYPSPTRTATQTATRTVTSTASATATATPTFTATPTIILTPTPSVTSTATLTLTSSPTATASATVTDTATPTGTATITLTPTPSPTATATLTATITLTGQPSATTTPTPIHTFTPTPTLMPGSTMTATPTATRSLTPTRTRTPTPPPPVIRFRLFLPHIFKGESLTLQIPGTPTPKANGNSTGQGE